MKKVGKYSKCTKNNIVSKGENGRFIQKTKEKRGMGGEYE